MQKISLVVLSIVFVHIQASPQNPDFCSSRNASASPIHDSAISSYGFKVIRRLPHDSQAYTQGLVLYQNNLYESTGILGKSTVRKIDMSNGAVLRESDISDVFFGEGLSVHDKQLIQMSWKTGKIFYFDPDLLKRLKTRFWDKEVWGSAFIENQLLVSDGSSSLFFVDPERLIVDRTIKITFGRQEIYGLNELEYVEGYIYANIWPTSCIVKIDPSQGNIIGWVDLSALSADLEHYHLPADAVLNGIAYQQQTRHFIVTGKYWPFYYEIQLLSDEK